MTLPAPGSGPPRTPPRRDGAGRSTEPAGRRPVLGPRVLGLLALGLLALGTGCTATPSARPAPTASSRPTGTTPGTTAGPAGPTDPRGATTTRPTPTTAPVAIPTEGTLGERLAAVGLPVWDDAAGDFYTAPDPLASGAPGDIIRVQPVAATAVTGAEVVRVMYHSRNRRGADRAVTGIVAIPGSPAPAEGRPIVGWAHGTTGISAACAPSRYDDSPQLVQHYLDQGYVWAATDYDGLGPPGSLHPYLSGTTEGRNEIDVVRAARRIALTQASARWVVYGHSQGGQAALFAGQLAPTYAPELHLLGTVAAAPVADLVHLAALADTPGRAYVFMALVGLPADYPRLLPGDYLSPRALDARSIAEAGCGRDLATALSFVPQGGLLVADPGTVEPARSILAENEPGQSRAAAPIFIPHGANDTTISAESSRVLTERMCALGQVVHRSVYPDQDHGGIILAATGDVDAWIADRFAGVPAPNDCPAPAG